MNKSYYRNIAAKLINNDRKKEALKVLENKVVECDDELDCTCCPVYKALNNTCDCLFINIV